MEVSIVRAAGLGVLVVGVVVALSVMIPLRNQLQENVELELMHAVDARASVVEQYLDRISDIALQITSRTRARQALESYNKGLSSRAEFVKLSAPILQDAISRSADGIGILRFDNQGGLAVSVGTTPAPDFRDWPGENLAEIRIDGPVEFDGRSILAVAAPILDSSATRVGTDIVVFDVSGLKTIIANREQSASVKRLFLLADSGEIPALIAASHAPNQDPGDGGNLTGDVQQALLASRQDRSASAPSFVTVTETAVIAYARIPGMPWTLALAQDASIVNAPIHRQLLSASLLIAALIGLGVVGIWRVIQPLTRQLSENRIFLDAVLDNMQEGVVACDADGVLSYFNQATVAFHGKAVSQLPPQEWSEHFDLYRADGETLMGVDEVPLYRAFQGEEVEGFEMVIAPKQGEHRFVVCNGHLMHDANGRRLGAVATMHDISRSKAAEIELRQSERRFRGAFDAAAHGIALVAPDGRFLQVNKSLCEMLGYAETELLQTDFQTLTHADDLDAGLELLGQLVAGKIQSYQLERRYIHKQGHTVWVMLSGSLVRYDSGVPQYFVSQIQDITAQKEIDAEREKQKQLLIDKQAAEKANQAKSDFLANMSHELRTPLNAIIGYSEILAEDAADAGDQQVIADLDKIQGSGRHLLSLINDILDLSKVEAGKMELAVEVIKVADMIDEVVATLQPAIEKNQNRLEVDFDEAVGEIYTDAQKLRQILYNLLSNAAKFTRDGRIDLGVTRSGQGVEAKIEFAVRDSGIGIDPAQMARLFQPFVQGDASTTRSYGGTGLGLVISQRMAELLGGDIRVQSDPGEGSVFTLMLPVQLPDTLQPTGTVDETESSRIPLPTQALPGRSVLVIDDDAEARDILRTHLQKDGWQVITASDGETGLRLARDLRPNVITLDVMMPTMDGWSVLQRLRANPELTTIPVIMCSIVDEKNLGFALGATDYLVKPVSRELLLQTLQKYIADRAGHVLVVDDEASARELLLRNLEGSGLIVAQAVDGNECLQRLTEQLPDIILLDLMMPETDGFAVIDALRQNSQWRLIPVIVITAKTLTQKERKWLNSRVAQVMEKGQYNREELLAEVSLRLERVLTHHDV